MTTKTRSILAAAMALSAGADTARPIGGKEWLSGRKTHDPHFAKKKRRRQIARASRRANRIRRKGK